MKARLILELDGKDLQSYSRDLQGDQEGKLDDAAVLVIERSLAAALSRVAVEMATSRMEMPVSQAAVVSALALEADAHLEQMLESTKLLFRVAEGQVSPYDTRYADLAYDLDSGTNLS